MKVYIIQGRPEVRQPCESDWQDTPYDQIESLQAARNTVEVLSNTEGWEYRIVRQVRKVVR